MKIKFIILIGSLLFFSLMANNVYTSFKAEKNSKIGLEFTLSSQNAQAQDGVVDEDYDSGNGSGGGDGWLWQARTENCTWTETWTIGGDPFGSWSRTDTYYGTRTVCDDGWSLCWSTRCS